MMQQLGLFDAPVDENQPRTFEALAQEYQQQAVLATTEVERDAYQHLVMHTRLAYPVNAVIRSIYLCTKIVYRNYGDQQEQRAIYLQEFPRFLTVQASDPHPIATASSLVEAFASGRDGAFQYRDGDPVLVWRNTLWRHDEDENPFVLSHLLSDSHTAVSSLDEIEMSGEWIVC